MEPPVNRPEWSEEKLRYSVLRRVYDRDGAARAGAVTGEQIGADLCLRYEDLFRCVYFLESHGFIRRLPAGFCLCITDKGAAYIEQFAGRRRSLRMGGA